MIPLVKHEGPSRGSLIGKMAKKLRSAKRTRKRETPLQLGIRAASTRGPLQRPDWPAPIRDLMSFMLTPDRWARKWNVPWTDELEKNWHDILFHRYHLLGVPRVEFDGSRSVLRGRILELIAPHTVKRLGLTGSREPGRLYAQGLYKVFIYEDDRVDIAGDWRWLPRRQRDPVLRKAFSGIPDQLEYAEELEWQVCPSCASPFPKVKNAKVCPFCQRNLPRREIKRRLIRVPAVPVWFQVNPAAMREPLSLVIAEGMDAPFALRRISIAPATAARFAEQVAHDAFEGEVSLPETLPRPFSSLPSAEATFYRHLELC